MSTTQAEAQPDASSATPEPLPALSQTLRRSGRRGTRILAVVSLITALGTTGYVVATAMEPDAATPLEEATAGAWEATGALSDSLRALRPGASRNAARPLAGAAAEAVETSLKRVEGLDLATADTPLRVRVLRALRADAEWIDAVGSTLANPRSPRRAELSRLAKTAAAGTSVVAGTLEDAKGTVGGTGRLLAATKQS